MKASAQQKLDEFGVDALCVLIYDGMSMTQIARDMGISMGAMLAWIAKDPDRSARVRLARTESAAIWDEKAEKVLENAPDEFELHRAKELAHHYRWRAAKIAPSTYGERVKQEVSGTLTLEQILAASAQPEAGHG